MRVSSLENRINVGDIEGALRVIEGMGKGKDKKVVPILIKHLESTENKILRNKIAIALSDIGSPEAIEPLMNMLNNPKTIGSRGTLLYALESFDCLSHVELIMDLLFDDNFEVSRQALILIEPIIKDIEDEIKQKYMMKIRNELDMLQEKIDFLSEVLDLIFVS